jgi:hypothetical protein
MSFLGRTIAKLCSSLRRNATLHTSELEQNPSSIAIDLQRSVRWVQLRCARLLVFDSLCQT